MPVGTSSDAPYSGTGTPTSIFSLYNAASNGLLLAENLIHATNIDTTNFPSAFTSASQLNSTNVGEIATDFAVTASSNASNFYALDTAWCETPTAQGGAGQSSGVCTSNSGVPPTGITSTFTGTVQPEVASAATNWPNLSLLTGFLAPASGVLNSAESATVSSSGTVTSTSAPAAYDVKLSAPSGGYILPSAFSMTFPSGLAVNTALVGAEVNAATNTSAVELNPTGTSIGTVTLTSPLADEFGGANNQLVGKVYVVQTGQSSGQGSVTQPYLELWFPAGGNPIYALGSFPSSLAFPLTLTFGEAYVSLLHSKEPLPINSLELNFPAATSPVKSNSCTTMGTAGGQTTDSIANLALEFGDTNDGLTSLAGTAAPVALAATPTVVTNNCTATVATPPKSKLTGSASGLTSGHPTVTLKVSTGTAFSTETVGLPGGLKFVKSKNLAKEISVSGAKVKSVKIAGGKLVITLKSKVKSDTIKTKKGLISESTELMKQVKKHKVKKLAFTVKAGSASIKASVNA